MPQVSERGEPEIKQKNTRYARSRGKAVRRQCRDPSAASQQEVEAAEKRSLRLQA